MDSNKAMTIFWTTFVCVALVFTLVVLLMLNLFHTFTGGRVCPQGTVYVSGQPLLQPNLSVAGCFPPNTWSPQ